jgi:hypothetical protein
MNSAHEFVRNSACILKEKKLEVQKREAPLSPGRWESVQLVRKIFRHTQNVRFFLYKEHPENNPENEIVHLVNPFTLSCARASALPAALATSTCRPPPSPPGLAPTGMTPSIGQRCDLRPKNDAGRNRRPTTRAVPVSPRPHRVCNPAGSRSSAEAGTLCPTLPSRPCPSLGCYSGSRASSECRRTQIGSGRGCSRSPAVASHLAWTSHS